MALKKEEVQALLKRINRVLKDRIIDEQEFREFEFLILESLRAILSILSDQK